MRSLFLFIGLALFLSGLSGCQEDKAHSDIVVTIKPIHSLLLALTQDTDIQVDLLGGGISSPHNYALKPSDIRQLNGARLIVQISSKMEHFLEKPISTLPSKPERILLVSLTGLTLLPLPNPDLRAETDHSKEAAPQKHSDHHAHNDGIADLHIWLDPQNMEVISRYLAEKLSMLFPKHAARLKQNSLYLAGQLRQLNDDIAKILKPVQNQKFMVYHNAFRYFENRYHLQNAGAMTLAAHTMPGSQHIIKMRNRMRQQKIRCLFTEPGLQPPLVKVLQERSAIKSAPLSALGSSLKPSPHLYFLMMRNLATGYNDCLSAKD